MALLAPFYPHGVVFHALPDAPTSVSYIVLPSQTVRMCWELLHHHRSVLGVLPVIVDESSEDEYACTTGDPSLHQPLPVDAEVATTMDEVVARPWLEAAYTEYSDSFADGDRDDWLHDPDAFMAITTPDQTAPYVRLALVEAAHVWELPMMLGFGGANACPAPHEHGAVWRYWDTSYGIHAIAITGDALAFRIERPPQTRPAARALAREHAGYNPDKVWQDTGSLERLAARLHKQPRWSFWWD
jgi:hypothetical protein